MLVHGAPDRILHLAQSALLAAQHEQLDVARDGGVARLGPPALAECVLDEALGVLEASLQEGERRLRRAEVRPLRGLAEVAGQPAHGGQLHFHAGAVAELPVCVQEVVVTVELALEVPIPVASATTSAAWESRSSTAPGCPETTQPATRA